MKDFSKEIEAYALKNALEFGKADPGRILPKLFSHGLDKKDIKNIMPEIVKIVKEINTLAAGEREKRFASLQKYVKEAQEEKKGLPELANVNPRMVFRLAPYPSGALHLGNAKTYVLNALYAEKYKGKTLLVMDDTIGSEEKKIAPEAYGLIEDAFSWLKVLYEKPVIYKSDRLKLYYDYGEKLLDLGKSYICHCSQEVLRKNRMEGKDCACRDLEVKEQKKRWKEMFSMEKGQAVMRLKTSMQHPNPAFRDRVLFKISDREHPRVGKKYRVWPTLEMSWAVDDHDLGITHILRGNDLMIESDMEKFIWDIFDWKHPIIIHTGLVTIEGAGAKLSKSKAQAEVASGEFTGWDDPRTWSVQSLRRRGFMPEALRSFIEEIGLNKQDITIPIETLYSCNRKMIDSLASRYSFVEDPVEVIMQKAPVTNMISLPVHPDQKETRDVKSSPIFISSGDAKKYKGQEVRLLHLYNLTLAKSIKGKKIQGIFTSSENKNIQKLQWVSESVNARILMPDGTWLEGLAEKAITGLQTGNVIQFERFGFVRFDGVVKKKGKAAYEFWFGHK